MIACICCWWGGVAVWRRCWGSGDAATGSGGATRAATRGAGAELVFHGRVAGSGRRRCAARVAGSCRVWGVSGRYRYPRACRWRLLLLAKRCLWQAPVLVDAGAGAGVGSAAGSVRRSVGLLDLAAPPTRSSSPSSGCEGLWPGF